MDELEMHRMRHVMLLAQLMAKADLQLAGIKGDGDYLEWIAYNADLGEHRVFKVKGLYGLSPDETSTRIKDVLMDWT